MARRVGKEASPGHFTSKEMAVVYGVSDRTFLFLADQGHAPPPVTGAGQGSTRYFDLTAVTEGAIAGGLIRAGLTPAPAGRLARVVMKEEGHRGRFPSNLESQSIALEKRAGRPEKTDDFSLLDHLRARVNEYDPRKAAEGDYLIQIVDREYVSSLVLGRSWARLEPLCRITDWLTAEAEAVQQENVDAALDALREQYAKAKDRAISILQVNVSLAIRVGLDEIRNRRLALGARR